MFRLLLCILLFLTYGQLASQDTLDILIKNARIVDGSGNPWYHGEIGITGDEIAFVGRRSTSVTHHTIDAKGQIVCPGFIDVHGHIESSIRNRPEAKNFILGGVTSIITGNCGGSSSDLSGFFSELEELGVALNVGSLIGHNTVRREVMGVEDRAPSPAELEAMRKMIEQGMEDGAVGFSTGLIYVPGTYSTSEEVIELAKVAGQFGGVYASHIRNESDRVFAAIKEAVRVGVEAELPVEISHFKVSGKHMWNASKQTIALVDSFRRTGIDVTVDQYPYTASSTTLAVLVPSWALAGGTDSLKARLAIPNEKELIKAEMRQDLQRSETEDYEYCAVANCPWEPAFNGKRIPEVSAALMGSRSLENQIETVLQLVSEGRRVQMVFHKMNEADVGYIMQAPFTMIASDAGIPQFGHSAPHPRAYGTNTRVLARYVRDMQLIGLEDAIRKMTSLPAQKFQLWDRGRLAPGYAADLLIFDENEIADQATFENPHAYAKGISYVLVNGEIVVENGQQQSSKPGKILRLEHSRK